MLASTTALDRFAPYTVQFPKPFQLDFLLLLVGERKCGSLSRGFFFLFKTMAVRPPGESPSLIAQSSESSINWKVVAAIFAGIGAIGLFTFFKMRARKKKAKQTKSAKAQNRAVAKDEATAAALYKKAAEQGHAEAQFHLGMCYLNGVGVRKDEATAVAWYRKAAEQGYARRNTASAASTSTASA